MPEWSKQVKYRALRSRYPELRRSAESCTLGLGKMRKECSLLGLCSTSLGYGACLHCFVLTVFKISCFTHNAVHGCYMSGYICHHVCWAHLNMLFSIMLSFLGRFRSTNTITIHSFVGEDKSTLGDYQTAKKPKNKQLWFSNTFGSHEPLVLPYNDIKKKNKKSHAWEGAWIGSHRLYPAPRSWLPCSSSREMVMYWQKQNRFNHLGKFNNIALEYAFTAVADFCSNHLSHFICFISFHLRLRSKINLPNLPLKLVSLGHSFHCPWFINISSHYEWV